MTEIFPYEFVKNYEKEITNFAINRPLDYKPVHPYDGPYTKLFLKTHFRQKDPITYIKKQNKDEWLYINKKGQLFFKKFDGEQPAFFFVEYLEHPLFILYKHLEFGNPDLQLLIYDDSNNLFIWTDDAHKATKFTYEEISWHTYLNHNLYGKYVFSPPKKQRFSLSEGPIT